MNIKLLGNKTCRVAVSVLLAFEMTGMGALAYAAEPASMENAAQTEASQQGGAKAVVVDDQPQSDASETKADATDVAASGEQEAVPGADAPTSPTNASTHIDTSAEKLLSPEELSAAYSKLMLRSAWDYTNATFADVLVYAEQYIGLPYVWAGKDLYRDGGFDCSGFVNWVYNNVCGMGINSDYTNAASLYYDYCTPVSEANAQPGDIVFWKGTYQSLDYISHVGIYCGNGIAIDAGDPIGYDRVTDIKNKNGQIAERVYGRLVTLGSTSVDLNSSVTKIRVADQAYTGGACNPKPTVVNAGSVLNEGTDYWVSYENNVNMGTATAVIHGIGRFAGQEARKNFSIYSDDFSAGAYVMSSAIDASQVLDVPGASSDAGVALQLYARNNTDAQIFQFEKTDDGYYTIRNARTGLYLSLYTTWAELRNTTALTQQSYYGGLSQKWCVKPAGNGRYVVSSAMDCSMVLDVSGGVAQNGSVVQAYADNGTAAQRWTFEPAKTVRERVDELAAANAGTVAPGTYAVRSAVSPSLVLDAAGAGTADGTAAQSWSANGTDAQAWLVEDAGAGYVTVRNAASGLALDVPSADARSGAQLQLWSPNGSLAQKWVAVRDGAGVRLVSALDDTLSVDLPGASTADGSRLQLYADNGTAAQRWSFEPAKTVRERVDELAAANAGTVAPGTYAVRSAVSPSLVLDAAGAGTADGTAAQSWSANGTDAQAWLVEDAGAGYVTVRNAASGLALDVPSADARSGAQLQLWSPNGSLAQKWVAVRDGAGVRLVSALDDTLSVDLPGASTADGSLLQLYADNGTAAQRWSFVTPGCTQVVPNGVYVIKSALNQDYVLDIDGASSANGANAQLYEANGTAAQSFVLNWVNGYYTISNVGSGKYLDLENGSAQNGANVQQRSTSVADSSRWSLVKNSDGSFALVNVASGTCATVASAAAANYANVQGAVQTGAAAQQWFLDKSLLTIERVSCGLTLQAMSIQNGGSGAAHDAVTIALNPDLVQLGDDYFYQFADCRGYTGLISAEQMNRIIDNSGTGRSGVFAGKGQAIIDAAKAANINEMYFMAHIMTETAWGTSAQAQGRDFAAGDATIKLGSSYYTKWCPAGRYYNFIGWGAYDSNPDTAYDFSRYYGWNSIETALAGAAEKVASNYLYDGQETVYEMRWNPDAASLGRVHQYCTDINWARTISSIMGYNYRLIGVTPSLSYRVPQYQQM